MKKEMIIVFVLLFTACEKKIDWSLNQIEREFVVVNGMITNENKIQSITLNYSVANLNDTARPVTGAVVSITDGSNTWNLGENDTMPGTYDTDTNMRGISGKTYRLNITAYGKTYTAEDQMPKSELFSQLRYTLGADNLYHITWVANPYNPGKPAMYEVLVDWSEVQKFDETDPALCRATLYYYTLTTIDVSQIFQPELEKISFPLWTNITERKYNLSPGFENYLRCLLLETKWRGGLFDSTPANLPTNLSEGALGYFAACPVSELSLIVTP
jgi:hypothetical protein